MRNYQNRDEKSKKNYLTNLSKNKTITNRQYDASVEPYGRRIHEVTSSGPLSTDQGPDIHLRRRLIGDKGKSIQHSHTRLLDVFTFWENA